MTTEVSACGIAAPHSPHPMRCDSGCQPDWHKDWCGIYGRCPGLGDRAIAAEESV